MRTTRMNIPLPQRTASALFSALLLVGVSLGQTTERVSVNSGGIEGDYGSYFPSISADGRFVAFQSSARNLVPGDRNAQGDVFVHDRQTGLTERVSVNTSGGGTRLFSRDASISADGRYVAFHTQSDDLVPGDTNNRYDIFVRDRQIGVTVRASLDSSGIEGNSSSRWASISPGGRYVSFTSQADNLVPGDTNGEIDAFVHDLELGVTERVSVSSSGVEANGASWGGSISADGRYVIISSLADNLLPGDTNGKIDTFVHDRQTGLNERVTVSSLGIEGNEGGGGVISANGRYVAISSRSDNLVPGDTNGESDVFIHDRETRVTERISVSTTGLEANGPSLGTSISADGRHVAFSSEATNLVPGSANARISAFVHDRQTGVTERVSVNSLGVEGNRTNRELAISADGRYVSFGSDAGNLVLKDTNGSDDVFVHDRWSGNGQNSIYLTGPATVQVGSPIDFTWQTTRGGSHYWLLYSQNMNGARKDGHKFDIGYPVSILARGVNATNGLGSHTSLPVPPRAAGYTIYFEVAARDENGVAYDSNVVGVTFQ
jgi:Tol biopolymer transport system component